jgi:transposase-like protein
MTPSQLKQEAIRLRVNERMSFTEISQATGLSKSTLSGWLQPYPLLEEEVKAKMRAAKRYVAPKKSHDEESKHYRALAGRELLPQQKGNIAEATVLFRLALLNFKVFSLPFDGDELDLVVRPPNSKRYIKLQVRWLSAPAYGLPTLNLRCADGHHKRRRYRENEFDFIVGYYLFNDTAYVYSFAEIADRKAYVAISEEHAERWDKLLAA